MNHLYAILLQITPAAADSSSATPAAAAGKESSISFFELVMKGGPVMIPLGLIFFIALFYIIERTLYIGQRGKIDRNLVNIVRDNLANGNIKGAQQYCERIPTAQAQVVGTGLNFLGASLSDIDTAMNDKAQVEISRMENRLNYLSLIGRIAPMLGFVGTIVGIINIFYKISLDSNINISSISDGLYQKMITSGAGLIVGLIAFVGYQLLEARVERFIEKIEDNKLQIKELLNQPGL